MRPVRFVVLLALLALACSDDGTTTGPSAGAGGVAAGGSGAAGSGGSGAASGAAGSGGNALGGAGGSGALPIGGAAGAGAVDAGSDAAPPLSCTQGGESFQVTITSNEQFKRIALPLTPGVEYRRVKIGFDYVPTQWSATCFNPATSKGSGFPAFESLVSLKRGTHWCKGGNLFELTLHGPAAGHGASNKAQAETYYKSKIHSGSGCGSTEIEAKLFSGLHGIQVGSQYTAEVVWDATTKTFSANLGPSQHTGNVPDGAKLVANAGETWYVVLSFDGGFLECYDAQGNPDSTAPCCWVPSLGWQFSGLSWELCQ